MRISDWSSDVCSSDLRYGHVLGDLEWLDIDPDDHAGGGGGSGRAQVRGQFRDERAEGDAAIFLQLGKMVAMDHGQGVHTPLDRGIGGGDVFVWRSAGVQVERSEEHTSELQSLMRISYAVFCLK